MHRTIEKSYPVLGGVVAGTIYFKCGSWPGLPAAAPALFTAVLTFSGIIIGFVATAKSILISIEDRRYIVDALKKADKWASAIDYVMDAAVWFIILAAICAAGATVDPSHVAPWHRAGFSVWIGASVSSLLALHRFLKLLGIILRGTK